MFGSLLMLGAILVVYYLFSEQTGQLNFDLVAPPGQHRAGAAGYPDSR